MEVLFGVGFGGGEALKRFVQQANDPLLFRQRGDGNASAFDEFLRHALLSNCTAHPHCAFGAKFRASQEVVEEVSVEARGRPEDDELARTEADSVLQANRNTELSILKAGRDFRQ